MGETLNKLEKLKRRIYLKPIQYTTAELPVVLGIADTKIREWTGSGRLPSYMIDGTRFVHAHDVVKFVERHRAEQTDYTI